MNPNGGLLFTSGYYDWHDIIEAKVSNCILSHFSASRLQKVFFENGWLRQSGSQASFVLFLNDSSNPTYGEILSMLEIFTYPIPWLYGLIIHFKKLSRELLCLWYFGKSLQIIDIQIKSCQSWCLMFYSDQKTAYVLQLDGLLWSQTRGLWFHQGTFLLYFSYIFGTYPKHMHVTFHNIKYCSKHLIGKKTFAQVYIVQCRILKCM